MRLDILQFGDPPLVTDGGDGIANVVEEIEEALLIETETLLRHKGRFLVRRRCGHAVGVHKDAGRLGHGSLPPLCRLALDAANYR